MPPREHLVQFVKERARGWIDPAGVMSDNGQRRFHPESAPRPDAQSPVPEPSLTKLEIIKEHEEEWRDIESKGSI